MQSGKALVRIFEKAGVDYIFSSPGTEWPPVWEALADLNAQEVERPKYINCRHEALAVTMAAGYTKVTSQPQAVLLHATAGPLNAAMALRSAYHERVPMVVCCGEVAAYGEDKRLPDPGGQWLHDLTDLGGPADMLRRCVKWSDRISSAAILASAAERAIQIAQEPPAGPVLLGIPFELMMEEVEMAEQTRANTVARAVDLDQESLQRALLHLMSAKRPVIVTEHSGKDPKAVDWLVQLSELLAIPVMESYRPAFLNFPRTHPLYLSYDPKYIQTSDLVVAVGAISPWYPASLEPKAATVIMIAEEFPNTRLPFWGYNVDLALIAPPGPTLQTLVKGIMASKELSANRPLYTERFSQIQKQHELEEKTLRNQAEEHSKDTPIDPRWLCHVINESIPSDAIIVEETTVHRTLIQNMVRCREPMSHFGRVTGGLGVGLGCALGVKLARKSQPVFALLGDGAFHYNPGAACLGLSQEYGLPIIVILFNNGRYLSMERSLLRYFPEGAAKRTGVHYGAPIIPSPDYQLLAHAYGGYGVRVENPNAIGPAIDEALRQSAGGKLSLVDVVLSDYTPR